MNTIISCLKTLSFLVIVSGSYFLVTEFFSENRKEHQTPQLDAQLPLVNPNSDVTGNIAEHNIAPTNKLEVETLPDTEKTNAAPANVIMKKKTAVVNKTIYAQEAKMPEPVEDVFDNSVDNTYSAEAQRELALSTIPEVVGEDISEQEAEGMQTLSPEVLEKIANARMFPDRPNKLSVIKN